MWRGLDPNARRGLPKVEGGAATRQVERSLRLPVSGGVRGVKLHNCHQDYVGYYSPETN